MPNIKYSGEQGLVQSTGSGAFQLSGVGLALDLETVEVNGENKTITSYGVTNITQTDGLQNITVPAPVSVSGAAGQQKLIVMTSHVAGSATIRNSAGTDLIGDALAAENDYALLMWTGSDWVCVAQVTT